MRTINVLAIQRISADDRAKIEASDPAIRLIDAGGWFEGEIRETWSDFAASRYLPPGATGSGTREERDRLLGEAEVIIGGWPFPLDHARQGTAAEMVSPTAGGRQQPARQRSVGQRRGGNDLARRGELTADRRICRRRHPAFRDGLPPGGDRSRSRRVRPSRLSTASRPGQDRLRGRRRRDRERGRQAVRRARHAGRRHPPSAAARRAAAARL